MGDRLKRNAWWILLLAFFLATEGDKAMTGDVRGIVHDIRDVVRELRAWVREVFGDDGGK